MRGALALGFRNVEQLGVLRVVRGALDGHRFRSALGERLKSLPAPVGKGDDPLA
jgi:hypothetical protein